MLKQKLFRKFWLIFILSLLLFVAWSISTAWAQGLEPSDDEVNRVASQLYCPICDNVSLDVCPLEACQAWRDLIREQLAQGWSDREITDYFVAQYGDRVLGAPPARGLNWLLYLAPPALILLGAGILLAKLRRRPHKDRSPDKSGYEDPYLKQVNRDLRKMD